MALVPTVCGLTVEPIGAGVALGCAGRLRCAGHVSQAVEEVTSHTRGG